MFKDTNTDTYVSSIKVHRNILKSVKTDLKAIMSMIITNAVVSTFFSIYNGHLDYITLCINACIMSFICYSRGKKIKFWIERIDTAPEADIEIHPKPIATVTKIRTLRPVK